MGKIPSAKIMFTDRYHFAAGLNRMTLHSNLILSITVLVQRFCSLNFHLICSLNFHLLPSTVIAVFLKSAVAKCPAAGQEMD